MYLPPVPVGVSPTTLPPIPTPVTKPGFPLDPPRFYLLGQIEYYFSVQNLATDLFLRRQMDGEGWIEIGMIASFNRMQRLTLDVSLVRDTMMISSMLEVKDNKVRLANDQWKAFILPHSEQNALSNTSRSSAAYSLANTLSGLQISGDDAATIQAKVTVAVLGTKSSIFQITEADGNGKVPEGEKDESSSNTTTGSVLTDATPAATTSPPTSDEEIEKRLPA
ncbi:uncharacterized protein EI90DRAFT_2931249 [Cantharellus anzutake]|uniref:uncharacterized protein n=1 Tax=Cantharellus anzutake TaxID=1750568 RepID=UPI001908416F|nr:uncharacterized protein EI90DRAFT_2931249 [Cantharellus anzutake]KAF8325851.1 hypothetical protein EI90DRAFT_2931249 [Cantharellus anzutake]